MKPTLYYAGREEPWIVTAQKKRPVGETRYFLLVSETEARALADGSVPRVVQQQARHALQFVWVTR